MWGSEVNEIPGFDINAPRKLNTKRSGRSSGGILVPAKRSLTQYISLIKQTSDYVWVKIDKKYSAVRQSYSFMFMLFMLSPSHSSYFDPDTLPL